MKRKKYTSLTIALVFTFNIVFASTAQAYEDKEFNSAVVTTAGKADSLKDNHTRNMQEEKDRIELNKHKLLVAGFGINPFDYVKKDVEIARFKNTKDMLEFAGELTAHILDKRFKHTIKHLYALSLREIFMQSHITPKKMFMWIPSGESNSTEVLLYPLTAEVIQQTPEGKKKRLLATMSGAFAFPDEYGIGRISGGFFPNGKYRKYSKAFKKELIKTVEEKFQVKPLQAGVGESALCLLGAFVGLEIYSAGKVSKFIAFDVANHAKSAKAATSIGLLYKGIGATIAALSFKWFFDSLKESSASTVISSNSSEIEKRQSPFDIVQK